MAIPEIFQINKESISPFSGEVLASLPRQQQILERALGATQYVARSLRALSKESGLTENEVREYCEVSSHIARSPVEDSKGNEYFGHIARLREKYHISATGRFDEEKYAWNTKTIYDIFISYAHSDAHIAKEIRDELENRNLKCFMAEKDVRAGADWNEDIRSALRGSNLVLLLITSRSVNKPWILLEAGAAWVLRKRIVPAVNQIDAKELIEPLSRSQARVIETNAQRVALARELAEA
jgi:hypothetical protein